MGSWLPLAAISGVALAIEVLLLKSIKNKYCDVSMDLIAWIYRIFSVGFISIFLIYKFYSAACERNRLSTQNPGIKNSIWKIGLMGLASATSIICYYRAVGLTPNVGLPPSVVSMYIPLAFIGGFVFLKEDPKKVRWETYTGMSLLVVSICLIAYGNRNRNGTVIEP